MNSQRHDKNFNRETGEWSCAKCKRTVAHAGDLDKYPCLPQGESTSIPPQPVSSVGRHSQPVW